MDRPIDNSYWVVPGKFLAGEYPGHKDEACARARVKAFTDAGITSFIDLTTARDNLVPYAHLLQGATHQRFPIRDVSVPDATETTVAILDAIDAALERGDIVYVHCWGGIGRTGVVVGCWLARHGYRGQAALDRLRELWKQCAKSARTGSPETDEQSRYSVAWAE